MRRIGALCSTFALGLFVLICAPASAQDSGPQTTPAPGDPGAQSPPDSGTDHDKVMEGSGRPDLKFRGFMDINLGMGTDANPLVFPLGAPSHTSFQLGELDLYMTSTLSEHLSFLAELVFGFDATNAWRLPIVIALAAAIVAPRQIPPLRHRTAKRSAAARIKKTAEIR